MGLFGGLFNKDPQEVKDFWKAFYKLAGSMNEKNFAALEEAAKACPDIWQGPFLLGIALDIVNKIPKNPEKAKEYHYKAEMAAKKSSDAEWVASFYVWYRLYGENTMRTIPHTDEEVAVRRLGVAAFMNYNNMKPVVTARDEKDDAKFWRKLFWTCFDTPEYEPFYDVFSAWESYHGGKASRETLIDLTNEFYKKQNKAGKQIEKIMNKINKGKELSKSDWDKWQDMYDFIYSQHVLSGELYLFDENLSGDEDIVNSMTWLNISASRGNAVAARMFAEYLFIDEPRIRNVARAVADRFYGDYSEVSNHLMKLAERGDQDAVRQLEEYFVKDLTERAAAAEE